MCKEFQPFIHMFETNGNKYFYDVNKNSIINLSEDLADALNKKDMEHPQLQALMEKGFLSDKHVETIIHPEDKFLEYHLNNKINMITIQVTQACNLRCTYCPYSGKYNNRQHSNKKMSLEMAKRGIDFLWEHSIACDYVNIGFYGGEPTIEFNLIKDCIEYAKAKFDGKQVNFSITTNGTIITREIIEYFYQNDVVLMISLDGPKEIHDKNRVFPDNSGSFYKVIENVTMIKENYPDYFNKVIFNVVADPDNDYTCTSQFLSGNEVIQDAIINASELNMFYRKEKMEISEDYFIKRGYELFKLFLSQINRFDSEKVSPLVKPRLNMLVKMYNEQLEITESLPKEYHHGGPCIPGAQRLFMSVDGTFYPCERVSEESEAAKIGHIDTGINLDKVRTLLNIGKLTEEKCKNCWVIRYCSLCLVSCDNLKELSGEQKLSYCRAVKADVEGRLKDICVLKEIGVDFN
ncbi:Cys-rich peptide radical SAM maturase CcpM [Ruminiclostridium josui]|uniref:Cys-rich peptide radical SAM maturase CcpM n=1 Tax=Ruminiclostridium josui TaxID=1499 RepID=UPI000465EB32|nr:Cys-rich peptide radical SAM maturase CcpM [Ruminiclostridium josui]